MCWAGADRLARIAQYLRLPERGKLWRSRADHMRSRILEASWNSKLGAFSGDWSGPTLDASVLLLAELDFVEPDDPRFVSTVRVTGERLQQGQYLFRYREADDFGTPENAFNICTFWYINALAAIGRNDEARDLFENMLARCNHLGMLSEDLDPATGELWGNYPQTYSMVGIINSAVRLSISWEDAL
jgi:GH15 family glucan-1,4-alpha-glucosidase